MACEYLDPLQVLLRCSLNSWTRALQTGGRNGCFGFSQGCRRWGEVLVAPWADWRLLVGFWMLGECRWRVKLGFGSLVQELADVVISGQKKG